MRKRYPEKYARTAANTGSTKGDGILLGLLLDEQRRTNELLQQLSTQLAAGAELTLPPFG